MDKSLLINLGFFNGKIIYKDRYNVSTIVTMDCIHGLEVFAVLLNINDIDGISLNKYQGSLSALLDLHNNSIITNDTSYIFKINKETDYLQMNRVINFLIQTSEKVIRYKDPIRVSITIKNGNEISNMMVSNESADVYHSIPPVDDMSYLFGYCEGIKSFFLGLHKSFENIMRVKNKRYKKLPRIVTDFTIVNIENIE